MSLNFSVPPKQYFGSVLSKPIALSTPLTGDEAPYAVVIDIPWNLYTVGAVGVNLTLQPDVTKQVLTKIRSVTIDNIGNTTTPVYVRFPDTNDTIVCEANSRIVAAVQTNGLTFNVYATSPLSATNTRVMVSNIYIDAINTNQEGMADLILQLQVLISQVQLTTVQVTKTNSILSTGQSVAQTLDLSIANNVTILAAALTPHRIFHDVEVWIYGCYNTSTNPLFPTTAFRTTILLSLSLNINPISLWFGPNRDLIARRKIFGCANLITGGAAVTFSNTALAPGGKGFVEISANYEDVA